VGFGRSTGIGIVLKGSRRALLAMIFLCAGPAGAAGVPANGNAHDQAIAAQAFDALDRGGLARAEDIAGTANDKLAAKILRWIDLERPLAGHSFTEISEFIDANPDWPHQATLRARAEEGIGSVPDTTLRQWFQRHKPTTPLARLKAADFMAADGQTDAARQEIRDVWVSGDFSGADEQLILSRYGDTIRPEDTTRRLDRLLWDNKIADAERLLPRVSEEWRLLADARIKLAASARGAEALVAKVPASLQNDPGLLYERMRWRRRADLEDGALDIIEHVKELGRPEAWWPDRQILARHLLQANDPARAYKLIAAHGLKDGPSLAEAEFTAGWIALRFFKNPQAAYGHFTRLYQAGTLPLTLSRGAYWSGRAADAIGQPDVALGWYEKAAAYVTTYYGQLAGAMPNVPAPPKLVPEPKANPKDVESFSRRELVRVVRLLDSVGQEDRLKPFLNRLTELAQTPSDHALIADLAEDLGRPDLGVMAAKKSSYAGITLLRAGYPVIPMPRNAGAEQALLLAFTRQESAFNVRAASGAGALGLMQLLPDTAKAFAKMLSLPFSQRKLTEDGVYNVTLGQAYVDELITMYNGSYVLAITAYNAGPGRVKQWIEQHGDPRSPEVDPVDWVEEIPFAETRDYVQRVLENLQVYRLRIGNKSLAFSLNADLRR
jgi:soluble lytic murein transglycosylase